MKNQQANSKSIRVVLGIVFMVVGVNGFYELIPPPFFLEPAKKFINALQETGYFFPFMSAVEILCGLFLLTDLYVPLVLIMMTPILFNILLFHLFLAPGLIYFPLMVTGLHLYLALVARPYSKVIRQLFQQSDLGLKSEHRIHKKKLRASVG